MLLQTYDWAVIVLFLTLSGLMELLPGYHQPFLLTDPDISCPRTKVERTSVPVLLVLVVAAPLGLILLLPRVLIKEQYNLLPSESNADLPAPATSTSSASAISTVSTVGVRAFCVAHSTTQILTTLMKNSVGRPRPDFLDRCQPVPHVGQASDGLRNGLVTDSVCSTPLSSHMMADGFRSFPSGHASTSFTGIVFLALFLDALLTQGARRMLPSTKAARVFIATLCMLLPLYIAVGRIADHRHHPTDVLAGAALGTVTALLVYALYAPPLPLAPLFAHFAQPAPDGLANASFQGESGEPPAQISAQQVHHAPSQRSFSVPPQGP